MKHLGLPLLVLLMTLMQGISLPQARNGDDGFVTVDGLNFVVNGSSFYINGFNAYWLMTMASQTSQRDKVTAAFQQAQSHGLTVARTWAFSDGTGNKNMPLQIKPGVYDENMFQALDFVVSEAKKHGIRMILSLVNNYKDYGGRPQYVNWTIKEGRQVNVSEDDFYTNALAKGFYKNHVRAVLTRINNFTGIAYKDEPAIMAWELINEPRCPSDLSGETLQAWIEEMASYLKSLDTRHLVEAGLEGFYGQPSVERLSSNPFAPVGTDYITNSLIPAVDFTTVHSYPEIWLTYSSNEDQMEFLNKWVRDHIQDAQSPIEKPVLFSEFGKSGRNPGVTTAQRDELYKAIYDAVYNSSKNGGPAVGALFWQLFVEGMESWGDGNEIIFSQSPSTAALISEQSQRLQNLSRALQARDL